jgi:UDP-2,4-diacetamido-2,4,6-trideoxy-beta-L-altropyranose hydrolase
MLPGTLIIRADATPTMGHGHVMRCLALAQAWQDHGGECTFVMSEPVPELKQRLCAEGFELVPIRAAPGSSDDAAQVAELARVRDASWVVVDGYQFNADYHRRLKKSGEKVLLIDDSGHTRTYSSDLVLDQNAGTREDYYVDREPYTELLLGSRYAMLRREFKRWRDWKREIPEVARKILITMGGSDPENLSERVIHSLSHVGNLETTVVVGNGDAHREPIGSAAAKFGGTLRLLENATNMPELMSWADIGVIAGGGTLWEALYMMCPVISFARNPVQRQILSTLERHGTVNLVGSAQDFDSTRFASAISGLAFSSARRGEMAALGRETIDGLGAERVCERMINGEKLATELEDGARVVARS